MPVESREPMLLLLLRWFSSDKYAIESLMVVAVGIVPSKPTLENQASVRAVNATHTSPLKSMPCILIFVTVICLETPKPRETSLVLSSYLFFASTVP